MNFLAPSKVLDEPWLSLTAPRKRFVSSERSGKWCVYRPGDSVDAAWIQVLSLISTGGLLCAKVSTKQSVLSGGFEQHVICVYTTDWEDREDVMRVRKVLRSVGFTERLGYKRDIDTLLGAERFVYEE
jgi:hypothetical protein